MALILSLAYDLLHLVALVMTLFVYKNADEITFISCIFNVLFTSCFLGAMIVIACRYMEQIRNVKRDYDGDIKAHLEECDNIISSRHFFFHDHFISFDNPMICDYDEIKTVYYWYNSRSGSYYVAIRLTDKRILKLHCTNSKRQGKVIEEFKKYVPTVKIEHSYPI